MVVITYQLSGVNRLSSTLYIRQALGGGHKNAKSNICSRQHHVPVAKRDMARSFSMGSSSQSMRDLMLYPFPSLIGSQRRSHSRDQEEPVRCLSTVEADDD